MPSSQKKILQLGVIGIGFGKQVLVPAFRLDERCQVMAICASTTERAEKAAHELAIERAYGNWHELVKDNDVQAIAIAAPPHIQYQMAMSAIEEGKAIFCEKPLAHTLEAASHMVELALERKLVGTVDFEFCELETWQKARQLLTEGKIGDIDHASVTWQVETYANKMGLKSWRVDTAPGGGALNLFACHSLYYLEWLLGPIDMLRCSLSSPRDYVGTGDTFVGLNLKMRSGASVTVDISTSSPHGSGHRLEFYGKGGALVLKNSSADYMKGFELLIGTRQSQGLQEVADAKDAFDETDGRILAVSKVAKRFMDWALDGKEAKPGLEDGLRVQYLIDIARRSDSSTAWLPTKGLQVRAGI